jgi:V/A-type H+-transporting ATPase subunit I
LTRIVEESNWEDTLEEVIHTERKLQDNRSRRQEVIKQFEELQIWEQLVCNPLNFATLHRTVAFFGSVHKKHVEGFTESILKHEENGMCYELVAEKDDRVYFLLLCHDSVLDRLNSYINVFSFSTEEYPFDKPQAEMRKQLEIEEARLLEEEIEIDKLIVEQAKYDELLAFADDYHLNYLLRKKKSLEVTYDGDEIIINGWIVAENSNQFKKLLADNIPTSDYQLIFGEVSKRDIDIVPIKLQNNKFVATFERLTELYSLPRYNEIDPTPAMTFFYLIFFGLMVSDLGYGLAVFLIGLIVRRFLKVKRDTRSFVDFLFYLSIPTMVWGVITGTFFGMDMPIYLISVTVDVIPMTILSIVIGFFHIMTGLVMQMMNQVKLKNYFDMMTGGLGWFLAFLGGSAMIMARLTPWFDSDVLFIAGAIITGIGLVMIVILPAVEYGKRWYVGLGKGLYALYGAIGYFGDFVSYTRLMALGVAGASVARAFNIIVSYLPLPLMLTAGVVLAIGLHLFNMFLSMLSAYVHGIRLEFIEFFGKFYTGGGRKFEPFKPAEKNVIITDSDEKE